MNATPVSEPISDASPRASTPHDGLGNQRRRRDRFGALLLGLGIVGLIATAVVVALGWRLVDRTGATLASSLELTSEALEAFDATISVAADSLTAAGSGLATLEVAVGDSEGSLRDVGTLLAETADAMSQDVPDSIDAIRETMPALIQSAEVLDAALSGLSLLGVDFAPATPPADSLRRVETGLADVADRLRGSSSQLDGVGRDLTELGGEAGSIAAELARLRDNLGRAETLLDGYATTTTQTAALVAQTGDDLDSQRTEGRLIVLLLGLVIGLGQLVPIAVGWRVTQKTGPAIRNEM